MSEIPFDSKNLMIDLETLATTTDAAILSIGWASFSQEEGVQDNGQFNVRSLDNLSHGRRIDPSTVAWWFSQDPEAIVSLVRPKPFSLASALEHLEALIVRHKYIWAKPPQFDLSILANAYDNVLVKRPPWHHRNERDARTVLALGKALNIPQHSRPDTLTKHCAAADAVVQAWHVLDVLAKIKAY